MQRLTVPVLIACLHYYPARLTMPQVRYDLLARSKPDGANFGSDQPFAALIVDGRKLEFHLGCQARGFDDLRRATGPGE